MSLQCISENQTEMSVVQKKKLHILNRQNTARN